MRQVVKEEIKAVQRPDLERYVNAYGSQSNTFKLAAWALKLEWERDASARRHGVMDFPQEYTEGMQEKGAQT